mmetsp:Transcript_41640/g.104069  ORF Transcript_41640/g.104069 Transcript_41640/m.104069 type:complete len:269 (+) Transcript_41640:48-854(+)
MESHGGGGFVQQSQSGFDASPSGKVNKNEKGIHPVTIRQMQSANAENEGDNLKVDGRDATQVTFIGQIISRNEQATNVNFVIDDGTGSIEVKQWTDTDETDYMLGLKQSLQEGVYVRVVGQLRAFNGEHNVTGFSVRPVTDMNEITYHLLDACHTHLYNTRGPPQEGVSKPIQQRQAFNAPAPSSMGGGPSAPFAAPSDSISSGGSVNDRVLAAFTDLNAASDQGINVEVVAQRLNLNLHDVKKAVDALAMDGHLYSTIDEDHYATTG